MKKFIAAVGAALVCSAAFAQYPNKPIKLIVPFPPGGAAELGARIFAQPLGQQLDAYRRGAREMNLSLD